jgi:hypothetical protein
LQVPVLRASTLLARHRLFHIDYCSIDTEGAELAILSDLDLETFHISVFTVENNYDDARIPDLMASKGYVLAAKLEQDYVFRRRDVTPLPRVSVICAVPQGLADRETLLRGHAETLARQTMPVEPIYVFEKGDEIPAWLPGRAAVAGTRLTRYQAWNVALSMVATPLVMTLDLAARLAPDAVEILERERARGDAMAVIGDWNICETQEEADAVPLALPSAGMDAAPGPSMLWRVDAHMRMPRYPWRLREGTPLQTAGESAFHAVLAGQLREPVAHAAFVIGRFPAALARMHEALYDESALLNDPGISIL